MGRCGLYFHVVKNYLLKMVVGTRDISTSYDAVSSLYDIRFLEIMKQYNIAMLSRLVVPHGARILDLACGTGFNSLWLLDRYPSISVDGVDLSAGMLREAAKKLNGKAALFQMSMLEYLRRCPDNTYHIVVCGWALKYQSPAAVLKECERVLKPGGQIGVILNTKSTLPEIRKVYKHLLYDNAGHVHKLMLELPNPKNEKQLAEWFGRAGLRKPDTEGGIHVFHFKTASEAVDWVTSTGALAGFDIMLNLHDAAIQEQMSGYFQRFNISSITHAFVWGVAEKC